MVRVALPACHNRTVPQSTLLPIALAAVSFQRPRLGASAVALRPPVSVSDGTLAAHHRVRPTTPASLLLSNSPDTDGLTYGGPDPYVDYSRRFTPEDGIAITYKTIDENGWRTAFRVLVLLAVIALAGIYAVKVSPYPMIPRGCPVCGPCPFPMRWDRYWLDAALLAGFSGLSAWILFAEVQVYREIEIRPDCMMLDGNEVFWAEKFEVGWPQFVPGEDGMQVLAGVYGTRWTEFLKVKAFDEYDRGPAVFAAHLAAAMQQQWGQPGQNA